VKPSAYFALTVIYGPPAECNPPGARECNTQLHSAYTRESDGCWQCETWNFTSGDCIVQIRLLFRQLIVRRRYK
jgi:hypothetical protein